MAKSRYFISKGLDKLEDAHVCFRYWSGRVCPSFDGAPASTISVVRQKIKKNLFATINKDDYIATSDPITGKLVYCKEDDFNEALANNLAKEPSATWAEQKLGDNWFSLIQAFITRFARKYGILPAITQAPLITIALSKDDWKDVKAKCLKFEIVATESAKKPIANGVKELRGYTGDMMSTMLDPEDKAGLANCVELIEVNKNGEPLK